MKLRAYQEEAVANAVAPKDGVWRRLLVLATGAGKTVIAAEVLNRLIAPGQRALFLAHRDELLTQAKAEIEGFVPDFHVEIEQAENRATKHEFFKKARRNRIRRVVVGSVQTMQRRRLKAWHEDTFDLVIIDECHHAAAKTYQNIVEHFGCLDDERRTPLIGMTATPMRSDNVGLDVLFQEISASFGVRHLIEEGHLCDLRAIVITTQTDLRAIKMTAGDYNSRQLEDTVDNEVRNSLILAAHRKYALDRPTLVFATGVGHAKHLAELFCAAGVPAEAMYGAMADEDRKAALERYKRGETRVLTNYALLTEGFNAPSTSCIILGRPSKSNLVITQQIGRGTRLYPGKEDCLVIDVRDVTNGKNLFTAASLAGLPANFSLKGKSMFKATKRFEELEKIAPDLARVSTTPDEVEANLARAAEVMRAHEIDLLRRKEERAAKMAVFDRSGEYLSPYAWYRISDRLFEISPDGGETAYNIHRIDRAKENPEWSISVRLKALRTIERMEDAYPTFQIALQAADALIKDRHKDYRLIDRNAFWMRAPATEKQINLLSQYLEEVPERLTKGEAAIRLNAIFARKKFGVPRSALGDPCFV